MGRWIWLDIKYIARPCKRGLERSSPLGKPRENSRPPDGPVAACVALCVDNAAMCGCQARCETLMFQVSRLSWNSAAFSKWIISSQGINTGNTEGPSHCRIINTLVFPLLFPLCLFVCPRGAIASPKSWPHSRPPPSRAGTRAVLCWMTQDDSAHSRVSCHSLLTRKRTLDVFCGNMSIWEGKAVKNRPPACLSTSGCCCWYLVFITSDHLLSSCACGRAAETSELPSSCLCGKLSYRKRVCGPENEWMSSS